jgi:Fic family protein
MTHGLNLLRTQLPLSLRLIREVHRALVSGTRGADKVPGEFRTSQNWIGGSRPGNARFVPPPPHEVLPALDNLEKFLHDQPVRTPPLLKAGLAHAQFETIHPFLDGNGRVGRLLITMILVAEGVLSQPMLYVSLHFKRNHSEYYERLQRVRTHGDWEGWIDFYLDGLSSVATQATETIEKILRLFSEDRRALQQTRGGSIYQQAAAQSNLHVHEYLCRRGALTIPSASQALELSKPTIKRVLEDMEALGIVREATGKSRNRLYLYSQYLKLLDEGT